MSMPLFPMLQPVLLPPLAPLETTQWPRGTLPAADTFFIRPSAHGNQDGTSWANALAFADIPRCLASLNAGGEVLLAAWDGACSVSSPVVLARSLLVGTATIRGAAVDNSPAKATINGTRVPWSTTNYAVGTPENGYDVFQIANATSGLTISFFNFTNVQRGVLFLGNADTITLSDLDAANVYMLWDAERDATGHLVPADTYTISNLTGERLTAIGYELGLFNSEAKMPGLVLTDLFGDSQGNYGTSFTEGIHLGGTVESPVFTRVYGHNSFFNNRNPGVYWNGDGLCTEHGVNNATWNDCGGSGSDDAGIDVKAENETYNGGLVARNKKNFKTWSTTGGTINDLISVNPVKNGGTDTTQHYLFAGSTGDPVWIVNRPVIRSDIGNTSALFRSEKTVGSVTVNIDSWLRTKTATTLSITGTNALNDSGNGLGGIKVETPLWLTGCANAANNNLPLYVTASAAGALTLARMDGTPANLTNEAAGASITIHWGIVVDPATTPVTT